MKITALLLASATFAFAHSSLARATTGASPVPVPETTEACAPLRTISADAAFAAPIEEPRALAFVAYVENVNPADRASILARAVKVDRNPEIDERLAHAPSGRCVQNDVDLATSRLTFAVAKRWNETDALALQLAAASDRDAALAVFGIDTKTLDAMLVPYDPSASPAPGTTCPDLDAVVTQPIEPVVKVTVSLDAHGFVRSVLPEKSSLPDRPGVSDLVTETILSAGTSTYRTRSHDCHRIPGSYVFRADFVR